jgi:hypothetical protein
MNKVHGALLGLLAISAVAVAANAHGGPTRIAGTPEATQMHCVSQGGVTRCQIVIDENTGTSEW